MHKTVFLVSFLFASLWAAAAVETIHFNIFLWGNKIGVMTVTHELRADGMELYTLESVSKAKLLWIDKENFSHYDVTYKDGRFISSTHREMENKKVQRWTNINWNGSQYVVDSYKGKRNFSEVPGLCVISMYFKDIRNIKRIFYEPEADYCQVEHTGSDVLEFKSSDGTRNVYYCENGRIKAMDFHISIATVKMVRTD